MLSDALAILAVFLHTRCTFFEESKCYEIHGAKVREWERLHERAKNAALELAKEDPVQECRILARMSNSCVLSLREVASGTLSERGIGKSVGMPEFPRAHSKLKAAFVSAKQVRDAAYLCREPKLIATGSLALANVVLTRGYASNARSMFSKLLDSGTLNSSHDKIACHIGVCVSAWMMHDTLIALEHLDRAEHMVC